MQGLRIEEIETQDEYFKIKEENNDADRVEFLEPFGHTFLCTICAKTHSKNFSCVDYGVFKSEVFLCSNQECGKIFENEFGLEQHGNSCQVTDPLLIKTATAQDGDFYLQRPDLKKCNDCQKKFMTKLLYLQHMRNFHSELIKCTLLGCNKNFRKKVDFEEHKLKDHENSVFCAMCGQDFNSKEALESHLLKEYLQQNRQELTIKKRVAASTECPYCHKFIKHLDGHLMRLHPGECVKCLQSGCRSVFPNEEAMQVHLQLYHVPVNCDICNLVITSKYRLKKHIVNIHKKNRIKGGKYECSYCGLFVKGILEHVRTFHPKKVLKCIIANCNRHFSEEKGLSKHLQIFHKFVKCAYCDEVFQGHYLCIHHVNQSHQGMKIFKCSFSRCIHLFKSYSEMEKHFKKCHPFYAKCQIAKCGHLASTLNTHLQHMKSHSPNFANPNLSQNNTEMGKIAENLPSPQTTPAKTMVLFRIVKTLQWNKI